jgi:hypothetical protein
MSPIPSQRPRPVEAPKPRRATLAALVAALLALPAPVAAQAPEELDRARALFREGVALSAANDWASALSKFKAVAQVKMTPQVAFNIAECEEHLGKLVSALGNYRLAASEAEAAKARDVAAQVDDRITALEARIPKLVIQRGEGADSARIELDGVEIGAAQIGTEIPVDPGPHVIVGKIDGQEGSRDTVQVAEKSVETVAVVIDLELLKKPVAPPPVDGPPRDRLPAGAASSPTLAYAITGAGVVSLGAGVVFVILRQGIIGDLDAACGGDETCPPSAEATADRGRLYTGLAEITIPLGVAGVATGIYLLATSSAPKAELAVSARGPRGRGIDFVSAAPGADVGGASLVGRF